MARTTSNTSAQSSATIGFEAKLWLTAEQAVPAPHFAAVEYNGARPEVLLGLIFPGAGLKIAWGPAARDFGRGQSGEAGASPQRAVTAEPTPATGKRPAARRGFGEKSGWLRCPSVGDRCGYPLVPVRKHSRLAIQPFPRKQDSHGVSRPVPAYISDTGESKKAEGRMMKAALSIITSSFILQTFPVAIELDNPRLKGVLPKDYARPGLDTATRDSASPDCEATSRDFCASKDHQRLGELIDVIATISLTAASEGEKTHRSVDPLGRVYEYFLTRFASAEGKNGGPAKCEVRGANVEVKTARPFAIRKSSFDISPDPACGSGGMFVQSEKFVESHGRNCNRMQLAPAA